MDVSSSLLNSGHWDQRGGAVIALMTVAEREKSRRQDVLRLLETRWEVETHPLVKQTLAEAVAALKAEGQASSSPAKSQGHEGSTP